MMKLAYLWFAVRVALCGCHATDTQNGFKRSRSSYKVSKIGRLPAEVSESSGLARHDARRSLWTHNDSGGAPELYEIGYDGVLLSTRPVPGAQNVDWEDLAQGPGGTLFVGDLGNNRNDRRDLTVYALPPGGGTAGRITLRYADQADFPPPPDAMNFDCEAFFYHRGDLYLFSKNRSTTNPHVKLYKVPARPGDYSLLPQDSLRVKSQITAADINPAGTRFALLTYGKVLLFDLNEGRVDFSRPRECVKVGKWQEEALVFENDTDMIITNEQGRMYSIRRK